MAGYAQQRTQDGIGPPQSQYPVAPGSTLCFFRMVGQIVSDSRPQLVIAYLHIGSATYETDGQNGHLEFSAGQAEFGSYSPVQAMPSDLNFMRSASGNLARS